MFTKAAGFAVIGVAALVLVFNVVLFGSGCGADKPDSWGPSLPSGQSKEKFFRGDLTTCRLGNVQAMVVDKVYVNGKDYRTTGAFTHDVWKYQIVVQGHNAVFESYWVYEFELVPPAAQPERTEK